MQPTDFRCKAGDGAKIIPSNTPIRQYPLLAMNFFDGGPLGPWEWQSAFEGELGCAFTFIGFVVFLVVVLILWQALF